MYDYWYSYKVKYNKKDTNDVKIFRWDYHVYFHIPYLERILQNQLIDKKLTWFVQNVLVVIWSQIFTLSWSDLTSVYIWAINKRA